MTVLCPIATFAVLTGPVGGAISESHDALTTFTTPDSFLAGPAPDRLLHTVIQNSGGASGGGGQADEAQFLIAQLREVERTDRILIHETVIRLIQIGTPAVTPLIKALQDGYGDADVRQQAAYALGKLRDTRAIVPLIGALNDESEYVRLKATSSIGRFIEDPRVIEPLINRALNDANQSVRWQALTELSQVKTPRAAETFIKALEDNVEDIRLRAISALGDIDDPRAIKTLENFTQNVSNSRTDRVRADVALEKIREAQKK